MSQATWTADGRIGASRDGQLITMRDDGGDVRPVAPGFDQVVDDASWSPDGSRIVVQAHPAGDPPWPTGVDLYVLAADGSDIRQLTSADGDELRPSWSPDGSAVIYDTLVDGVPRVMTIPAARGHGDADHEPHRDVHRVRRDARPPDRRGRRGPGEPVSRPVGRTAWFRPRAPDRRTLPGRAVRPSVRVHRRQRLVRLPRLRRRLGHPAVRGPHRAARGARRDQAPGHPHRRVLRQPD